MIDLSMLKFAQNVRMQSFKFEETFCLDLLCSFCWLQLSKCLECNRPGCGRHADHFIRRSYGTTREPWLHKKKFMLSMLCFVV